MGLARRHVLLAAGGLALAGRLRAAGATGPVWLVVAEAGLLYDAAAQALAGALREGERGIELHTLLAPAMANGLLPAQPPALVITLGAAAYRAAVARLQGEPALAAVPVLAALLSRASFNSVALRAPQQASAVLLDQPVERTVELVRQALPGRQRVGVLFGPASLPLREPLQRALAARGLQLVERRVLADAGLVELHEPLQQVLDDCDVLLALPDSAVYHSDNLRNILIASYRRRIPLVAYAQAQVRAGATLALYTTPEQTAQQVAALALAQLRGRRDWPRPVESELFEVLVNEQVGRSLGLGLASGAALAEALRREGGRR